MDVKAKMIELENRKIKEKKDHFASSRHSSFYLYFDLIHLDLGGFDVIYLNKDVLIYAIQCSVDRTSAFIEICSGLYSRV